MKSRTFIDSAILYAEAGDGGNGCVSFRREKFVPKGGPDGGDGGNGGSVILRGNRDDNSLIHIYYSPHQRAHRGGHGKGKKLHGRNGGDCIVKVPCGTEVWDENKEFMLGDIVEHDQELIVAQGGRGGKGNCHWKSATHQAPHEHTDGGEGRKVTLRLELKLMADIGLVGFPNAGKSSLLTEISDAHPKVGAYPFTTLNPVIGTVMFPDYTRMTVADIPGLIEGAHDGVGLGHAFLKHIERSRFLVYVIDMAGVDNRKPYEDYACLRNEINLHRQDLIERPFLVLANKMDLPAAASNLPEFIEKTGVTPITISALSGEGIDALRQQMYNLKH